MDMETQKRNMALLKDYKIGAVSGKTHAALVDETFLARRKFIESEATSCANVLATCPFLNNKESKYSIFFFIVSLSSFTRCIIFNCGSSNLALA